MPDTPESLRRAAEEDRRRADDLDDADETSSYPEYLRRRAVWREQLARDCEVFDAME